MCTRVGFFHVLSFAMTYKPVLTFLCYNTYVVKYMK